MKGKTQKSYKCKTWRTVIRTQRQNKHKIEITKKYKWNHLIRKTSNATVQKWKSKQVPIICRYFLIPPSITQQFPRVRMCFSFAILPRTSIKNLWHISCNYMFYYLWERTLVKTQSKRMRKGLLFLSTSNKEIKMISF